MFKQNDLIDIVLRHLAPIQPPKKAAPRARREFLTEYEIKKTLTIDARRLTIPKRAIISPLAQEWLALKGIEIIRADS